MTRAYDMRGRSRAAAGTRAAIVTAAHRLLNRRGGGTLALHEVARAAGVSRAAVYKSVGSRRALLAAVFEDQGRLIGFDRVLAAMRLDDPAAAVIATVRESCRAWAVMPAAIRRTLALAAMDDEVAALVQRYERHRRAAVATLAGRAHRAGVLRAGISVPAAAATLTMVTGFPAFDQLLLDHRPPAAGRILVAIAANALGLTTRRAARGSGRARRPRAADPGEPPRRSQEVT